MFQSSKKSVFSIIILDLKISNTLSPENIVFWPATPPKSKPNCEDKLAKEPLLFPPFSINTNVALA